MNAPILSDVTIGDGAVIGANSLVTKDVEPYMIVKGNPANQSEKDSINRPSIDFSESNGGIGISKK